MKREPTTYSRPIVVGGLAVVLLADLVVGLSNGLFVGGGAVVLLAAAIVHAAGDEPRAAAGWGFFALGFGFFGVFGAGDTVVLLAVGSLLVAGLALQVSQRVEKRVESGGN